MKHIIIWSLIVWITGCQNFADIDGYTWYSDSDSTSAYDTASSDIPVVSSDSDTTSDSTTNQGPFDTDTNTGTIFYTDSASPGNGTDSGSGNADSSSSTIEIATDSPTDTDVDTESNNDTSTDYTPDTNIATDTDTSSDSVTDNGIDSGIDTNTETEAFADSGTNADSDSDTIPGSDAGCEVSNGGVELCDGIDNNCNGSVDESFDFTADALNCGGCGNNCMLNPGLWEDFGFSIPDNMASAACVDSKCLVAECDTGYVDLFDFPPADCNGALSPESWCDQQTIPAGIETDDWQCLDFDEGLPESPWVQDGGSVEVEMTEFVSSPSSINIDAGVYRWNVTGSSSITSVTISADIQKAPWPAQPPPWSDGVNLICIQLGNASDCFQFQHMSGFNDRFLFEKIPATIQIPEECEITFDTSTNWVHVDFIITQSSVDVLLDGASALEEGCDPEWSIQDSATISFGASGIDFYYDNVEVAVER